MLIHNRIFLKFYLSLLLHLILVAAGGILSCSLLRPSGCLIVHLWLCSLACKPSYLLAWGILVPQPGIEPASPALADGFFTTGLPGGFS